MATKRTTRPKAAPATGLTPKPPIEAKELARFLGLGDKAVNYEQMEALLGAAQAEAHKFMEMEVPADKQSHIYQQGLLHLAAKFYAAGNSNVEKPSDIPMVCRYFFELVRRELSGSAE